MTRNRYILLAVALLLAGLLAWQMLGKKEEAPSYVTAEVQRGDLNEAITANGVLNPISVINVGTQVSGTVQELKADFNDRVVEGQILLRLDPALFASQLAASEAQLANARAQAQLQAANVRRAAELDAHLACAHGQALAAAQIERHARPAPVIDQQTQRHKGLDV